VDCLRRLDSVTLQRADGGVYSFVYSSVGDELRDGLHQSHRDESSAAARRDLRALGEIDFTAARIWERGRRRIEL
jgi:hypothetical protein